MKSLLLAIVFLPQVFQVLGGEPKVLEDNGPYSRVALTENATMEMYQTDSIVVVMTVCAPQCSSCARVYNKEWQLIEEIQPPFRSIFPLATINPLNGEVIWKNNDDWEY